MSDPMDVDWEPIPIEQAQRMIYVPQMNDWEKAPSEIKVSKAMYATGSRNGCILFKDMGEQRYVVIISKSLHALFLWRLRLACSRVEMSGCYI